MTAYLRLPYVSKNYRTFSSKIQGSQEVWHYVLSKAKANLVQTQKVPEGRCSHIFRQSVHERKTFVSLKHRPHLPPENIPGTHLSQKLSRRVIVRPEGLRKIPTTPLGIIEPATFRLVAQFLKRLRHCVPSCSIVTSGNHYTMKWCGIPEKRLFQSQCQEEMKTRRDIAGYNAEVIIT